MAGKSSFLSRLFGRRQLAAPAVKRSEIAAFKGTLIAKGLTKSYKSRCVVNGVSLGVRAGEAVGLLGPNGAGKTTCFYMVTGLVPVDHGTIEIDGFDVTSMPMYRRARLGIGYLPQESSIFRGLTVEQNIRAVLEVVEKSRKQREHDLDALLASSTSRISGKQRRCRSPAASGGAWRSRGRLPAGRITCCSTSPSRASIRSPSPTSSSWSGT
jgi:lipopolysaccharide export system ATP-binding protein